jgi:exodeoxyribonuclease VII large subunit
LVPRFETSIYRILADLGAATRQGASLLESLSFEQVLERGYVVVYDGAGQPITRGGQLQYDDAVALQFSDVNVNANITGDTAPKQTKDNALENETKWQGADPQRRLL